MNDETYGLGRFDDVLEVPLDNIVEGELRKFGLAQKLFPTSFPKWDSIKNLDPPNSAKYQQIAQEMASHNLESREGGSMSRFSDFLSVVPQKAGIS